MSKIKKVIAEAKKQIDPHVHITRTVGQNTYFKVDSFKGVYNESMKQAPEWFRKFEEKNDERWERQEKFNADMLEFKEDMLEFKTIMLKRTTNNMLTALEVSHFTKVN